MNLYRECYYCYKICNNENVSFCNGLSGRCFKRICDDCVKKYCKVVPQLNIIDSKGPYIFCDSHVNSYFRCEICKHSINNDDSLYMFKKEGHKHKWINFPLFVCSDCHSDVINANKIIM